MLDLKQRCIHPDTQKPYIVSSTGGQDCSVEEMQVKFESHKALRWCLWLDRVVLHMRSLLSLNRPHTEIIMPKQILAISRLAPAWSLLWIRCKSLISNPGYS